MPYNAVCFDLDGTLLDTLDDLGDSMNAVLDAHGLPSHPIDAYRTFVGDGVSKLVTRASGVEPQDERFAALLSDYRDEYGRRWADKTRPYSGVPQMLLNLAGHGLYLAVLSNKPHDFTQLCVARFLSEVPFAAIQGVEDDVPPKPDPTGALRIAEDLGVLPESWLYVGDTNTDMLTAKAAGMFAVGVTWGFRSADELRDNGAMAIINHPRDLLGLL